MEKSYTFKLSADDEEYLINYFSKNKDELLEVIRNFQKILKERNQLKEKIKRSDAISRIAQIMIEQTDDSVSIHRLSGILRHEGVIIHAPKLIQILYERGFLKKDPKIGLMPSDFSKQKKLFRVMRVETEVAITTQKRIRLTIEGLIYFFSYFSEKYAFRTEENPYDKLTKEMGQLYLGYEEKPKEEGGAEEIERDTDAEEPNQLANFRF